ncbi:GCN5 family acetyltransferase [Acidovorax sp. Root275]|nr:GCN5 family acetyltransferase [Acidovorax sp. Root275]
MPGDNASMSSNSHDPTVLPLVRPATDADLASLARVWRRAWCSANPSVASVAPPDHWEARVRAEFGLPCVTLVRAIGQEVTAFLVLDMAHAHLHQLFVDPDCQGQGVGAALLQQVHHLCPGGWTLHVATANHSARRFYARHGLVEGAVDTHPATGRERVLCRWLPPAAAAAG